MVYSTGTQAICRRLTGYQGGAPKPQVASYGQPRQKVACLALELPQSSAEAMPPFTVTFVESFRLGTATISNRIGTVGHRHGKSRPLLRRLFRCGASEAGMAPEQWKALKLLRGLVTSLGKPGTVEVILPDDFGIASGKSEKIKVIGGPAFINRLTNGRRSLR